VSVRWLGPSPDGRCSVAFAIGRRTGSAVVRNRIRRRLRALLDELAPTGVVPTGALLLSAGPAVATAPFPTVRRDLLSALARAQRPVEPR